MGKNYVVGVIYRPPGNVANFVNELNALVGKISGDDKQCY